MRSFEKIYVLDTNILLEDASNLFKISEEGKNLVVLPETVIDEIDTKKSGFDEINFQAREFGRHLSEGKVLDIVSEKDFEHKSHTVTRMKVGDATVDIVSLKTYNIADSERAIINDRKIIEVASFAQSHYSAESILLSNDVMCRIRAISLGVKAESLTKNKDVADVEFIRTIEDFDQDKFALMNHEDINKFVKDHRPDNFGYHFKCTTGNEKLAYVVNDRVSFITEDTFSGLSVKPLNIGQKLAAAGMLDERTDVCVFEALAGSGKTLMAIASGIKLVEQGKFDRIVYIRNSVESVDKAEEVGFLPGMESKFMIYNYPLLDTLTFIAKADKRLKDSDEYNKLDEVQKLQYLQSMYKVETMWPGASRGRSLSNCFVVIDEVQNFSKKSLQTVMTRFDKDCKVVCIGSNRQIDHPFINKYTNGLNKLLKATKVKQDHVVLFGSALEKCVRGNITEWAEETFED